MRRRDERVWTKEEILDEYRTHAGPRVAQRVAEVMSRVEQAGRLQLGDSTISPAFGILGDQGKRILSIREHFRQQRVARISVFLEPDGYSSPAQYEEVVSGLRAIAKPGARDDNHSSWDATDLARLSDDEYTEFLALLDWLGPLQHSSAS